LKEDLPKVVALTWEKGNIDLREVLHQSGCLNGRTLNRPWFHHSDLASGGTLELRMGPEPNPDWGILPEQAPPVWE